MTLRSFKTIGSLAVAAAMALLLIDCRGATGQDGRDGDAGKDGQHGNVINIRTLTSEQWANLRLKGEVTGVTMGTTPIVDFKLTDHNDTPISGMGWTSKASTAVYANYPNLSFGIAKLIPEKTGDNNLMEPSRWVNYIVTSNPTAAAPDTWNPTRPTTDNIGTLVDNGDGTYKYTFRRDISQTKAQLDAFSNTGNNIKEDLDDVTYQPTLTHRITIQAGGAFRGTGNTGTRDANTPDGSDSGRVAINTLESANIIYDFIPSTGKPVSAADAQRELVSTAACNDCHGVLGHGFHNGGRTDARYCAMCHTDQRKYGYANDTNNKQKNRATGNFIMLGHTLHMGNRTFQNYQLTPRTTHNYNYAGIAYKETCYPMDIRNCTQCHRSDRPGAPAPQGDNWKKKPSRLACGSCHDGIDWDTARHHGGVRLEDRCGQCHSETANPSPFNSHRPVDVTRLNTTTSDRFRNFTYDLRSATLNGERRPVVQFRIKLDGEPIINASQLTTLPGFTGGPGFYFAYALPKDGIDKPADFNASANANVSAATNTFSATPDAEGYWTATLNSITIPVNASMVTCYMTRGYVQTDISSTPDTLYARNRVTASKKVLVTGQGYTARREVVSAEKCNDCHDMLGASYITRQYGAHGQSMANDPSLCGVCHWVNRSSMGWSGNIQYITHAVHGIGKRTVQYGRYINVVRPNVLKGIGGAGYSGVLNNCEQCHLPGTYDFSNPASLTALPSLLWSTVASGTVAANVDNSPYIVPGSYGDAFTASNQAAITTLVNSPITHACFGCHDSVPAVEHMKLNGGSFFATRGSLNGNVLGGALKAKVETCLICHGSGKIADIKSSHSKF
ncbi:MAG: OmcA/MtrC family decaheme c-type cytochrome [Holophagales bacterium]|nr:OmcA/MtrC family decaheme c-type cytochrome [Holophagales bacterium]